MFSSRNTVSCVATNEFSKKAIKSYFSRSVDKTSVYSVWCHNERGVNSVQMGTRFLFVERV